MRKQRQNSASLDFRGKPKETSLCSNFPFKKCRVSFLGLLRAFKRTGKFSLGFSLGKTLCIKKNCKDQIFSFQLFQRKNSDFGKTTSFQSERKLFQTLLLNLPFGKILPEILLEILFEERAFLKKSLQKRKKNRNC